MVTQPRRAIAVGLLVFSFALVAFMTLRPTRAIVVTPAFCIFCGSLGGVDFILNVILFVPLGASLRWTSRRWSTAAFIGVVTTLVIESLQWSVIAGRDASLGDLLANSLGTMLGAWLATAVIRWLNATGIPARRIAAAFGIAASLVVAASSFLLQPAVPRFRQFVLWTPLRPNMDPFHRPLVAVELNGRNLQPMENFEGKDAFDTLTRSLSMRVHIGPQRHAAPTRRLAMVVRVANSLDETFSLAQLGDAAAFRTHIAAVRFKLHSLLVGLDGAFSETQGEVIIEGHSDPRAISLRRYPDGPEVVTVRRTVGLAWALFLPRDVALNQRWWPVNAIWLWALLLPAAFFAIRSSRAAADTAASKFALWPVALAVAVLCATPATGLSPLSVGEWAGVLAGITSGWVLERWAAPRRASDLNARARASSILS